MRARAWSSKSNCFATSVFLYVLVVRCFAFEDLQVQFDLQHLCQDVAFAKDLHFLTTDFDVASAVLAVDHGVTD